MDEALNQIWLKGASFWIHEKNDPKSDLIVLSMREKNDWIIQQKNINKYLHQRILNSGTEKYFDSPKVYPQFPKFSLWKKKMKKKRERERNGSYLDIREIDSKRIHFILHHTYISSTKKNEKNQTKIY